MIRIELSGLEVFGYHGVSEEERKQGQRFLFDVSLAVDDAALSDRLENTVDYRDVAATVYEVSDSGPYHLIEALAAAVADALLARYRLERVRVRVRKPDVDLPVEFAAATVERSR